MKKITISLAAGMLAFCAVGEVFVGSSNSLNVLSVPTNQTLLISSLKHGSYDAFGAQPSLLGLISQNGATNTVSFTDLPLPDLGGPYAITGACEIVFVTDGPQTSSAPVVVSYKLVQNSAIHSFIQSPSSTNVITVPTGKSIRFLAPTRPNSAYPTPIAFQKGAATIYNIAIKSGDEFTGPLTITTSLDASAEYSQLISYYFTEDFLVVPETGYLQGPSGIFEIAVEKSVNLTSWFPVVVHNTSADQKAFYRLRIQK